MNGLVALHDMGRRAGSELDQLDLRPVPLCRPVLVTQAQSPEQEISEKALLIILKIPYPQAGKELLKWFS